MCVYLCVQELVDSDDGEDEILTELRKKQEELKSIVRTDSKTLSLNEATCVGK